MTSKVSSPNVITWKTGVVCLCVVCCVWERFMHGVGVSCLSALKLCKHRYLNARGSNNERDVCRLSGSSVEMMYKQRKLWTLVPWQLPWGHPVIPPCICEPLTSHWSQWHCITNNLNYLWPRDLGGQRPPTPLLNFQSGSSICIRRFVYIYLFSFGWGRRREIGGMTDAVVIFSSPKGLLFSPDLYLEDFASILKERRVPTLNTLWFSSGPHTVS